MILFAAVYKEEIPEKNGCGFPKRGGVVGLFPQLDADDFTLGKVIGSFETENIGREWDDCGGLREAQEGIDRANSVTVLKGHSHSQ